MRNCGRRPAILAFLAICVFSPKCRGQNPGCTPADRDCDGIPDQVEHDLLARFSPYFRFSRDNGDNETFRPADVPAYLSTAQVDMSGSEGKDIAITRGSLASNPSGLVQINVKGVSSNLITNRSKSFYHVNPDNDSGRRGVPWNVARATRKSGLYGHVAPIYLGAADQYDEGRATSTADSKNGTLFYKVEYWQFFGYSSNDKPLDEGDHEADWDTVQMIVLPGSPATHGVAQLKTVMFYAHGKQMRFDLSAAVGAPLPTTVNGGPAIELRGPDYSKSVPDLHDWGASEPARNHVLQLYKDPNTSEYSHPVVYVEHGGHEFWPSPAWSMIGAQKHGGDDVTDSYLAATPPNLGEVQHPLSEDPAATAILQFNGYWGTYSREMKGIFDNNPPPGPPLHFEWTYPWNQPFRPASGAQEY